MYAKLSYPENNLISNVVKLLKYDVFDKLYSPIVLVVAANDL